MSRTIIVGDVHGCNVELESLLDRVAFAMGDRLVFVGDLIARGPDSCGVLDIARSTGAIIVRGNHEQKLLSYRARLASRKPLALGKVHADVARALRPVDWTLLATSLFSLDLPEHNARIVHAGIVPGIPFEAQERRTLMRIRGISARGRRVEKGRYVLWGALYNGPPHIVFGHNAMSEPQLHPWATGLDTSCVYGGRLTAMVLGPNETIARGAEAKEQLVSVPARMVYYVPPAREKRVA